MKTAEHSVTRVGEKKKSRFVEHFYWFQFTENFGKKYDTIPSAI